MAGCPPNRPVCIATRARFSRGAQRASITNPDVAVVDCQTIVEVLHKVLVLARVRDHNARAHSLSATNTILLEAKRWCLQQSTTHSLPNVAEQIVLLAARGGDSITDV
jgi:hypothetical protein